MSKMKVFGSTNIPHPQQLPIFPENFFILVMVGFE
jgi:hypothetical protein